MSLPLAKLVKLFLIFNFFLITNILPVVSQEASGLSLGKPLESIREPGEIYLAGSKGDWNVRCVTGTPGEKDKCEIQQLIFLNENTPIADISIFKLPDGEIAVAAANVMVPLETLLTKNFRFAFSDKIVKEFEYSFCNKNGCLSPYGAPRRRYCSDEKRIIFSAFHNTYIPSGGYYKFKSIFRWFHRSI